MRKKDNYSQRIRNFRRTLGKVTTRKEHQCTVCKVIIPIGTMVYAKTIMDVHTDPDHPYFMVHFCSKECLDTFINFLRTWSYRDSWADKVHLNMIDYHIYKDSNPSKREHV